MECPRCGLINPATSWRCERGYRFGSGGLVEGAAGVAVVAVAAALGSILALPYRDPPGSESL